MLSRDKRPQAPRPFTNPNTPAASVHPAFLPVRVHATVPPAPVPPPSPPARAWSDASKVSPAWEGWGRGPATVVKPRM
jgi:hypothetical protein